MPAAAHLAVQRERYRFISDIIVSRGTLIRGLRDAEINSFRARVRAAMKRERIKRNVARSRFAVYAIPDFSGNFFARKSRAELAMFEIHYPSSYFTRLKKLCIVKHYTGFMKDYLQFCAKEYF